MRKSLPLVLASVASLIAADLAVAQPPPGFQGPGMGRGPHPGQGPGHMRPGQQTYYYNGRWVGPDEWRRYEPERDRWVQRYDSRRYRYRDHDYDDSSALAAAIIGFALGAAIVGSMQQAERARTADADWDSYCARKYRSYDRRSRTYLSFDGLRHYCQ